MAEEQEGQQGQQAQQRQPTIDSTPQRLPLVIMPENRSVTADKDAKLVNGYVEKTPTNEYWIYKRPGLLLDRTLTGNGHGVYNWNGPVYSVFGTKFYENGTDKGTVNETAGRNYTFSASLGATPKLFFQNGTEGYTYDSSGGLVEVTDVNYPATTVPGNVYLDATTYVMDSMANIYGSDLNDPTSWDALNVIKAQIEPDHGVALASQLVYVIAFKQWSTEVFYDAANSSGSPLASVAGAKVSAGCRSAGSIQDIDGSLVWISATRSGQVGVMLMDNLKAVTISTPAVERLLHDADFTTVVSFKAKIGGHRFYVVTMVLSSLTLVYDLSSGLWAQWNGLGLAYFPFLASSFDSNQQVILQHTTNGKLYQLDLLQYTDDGEIIQVDLYTPNYDGNVKLKKTLTLMYIVGDQTAGSQLKIRCNDDDYNPKSWTNFRTVDLSTKRPMLTNCGTFVRRAYHLQHRANTPLRIKAIELHLRLGTL